MIKSVLVGIMILNITAAYAMRMPKSSPIQIRTDSGNIFLREKRKKQVRKNLEPMISWLAVKNLENDGDFKFVIGSPYEHRDLLKVHYLPENAWKELEEARCMGIFSGINTKD
jgi:hypothetical protein